MWSANKSVSLWFVTDIVMYVTRKALWVAESALWTPYYHFQSELFLDVFS